MNDGDEQTGWDRIASLGRADLARIRDRPENSGFRRRCAGAWGGADLSRAAPLGWGRRLAGGVARCRRRSAAEGVRLGRRRRSGAAHRLGCLERVHRPSAARRVAAGGWRQGMSRLSGERNSGRNPFGLLFAVCGRRSEAGAVNVPAAAQHIGRLPNWAIGHWARRNNASAAYQPISREGASPLDNTASTTPTGCDAPALRLRDRATRLKPLCKSRAEAQHSQNASAPLRIRHMRLNSSHGESPEGDQHGIQR
jgi:hypothetical protein